MDESRRRPAAREVILRAATELIRVNGVAGTSISDVITRSGTSAGAIYHHFGSKERLVLEVGRNAMAVPMTMIMATATDLSPDALFAAALDRVGEDEHTPELLLQIWAGAKSDPSRGPWTDGSINCGNPSTHGKPSWGTSRTRRPRPCCHRCSDSPKTSSRR